MKRGAHRAGWVSDGLTAAYLGTLFLSAANGFSFGLNGKTLTAGQNIAGGNTNAIFQPDGLASSFQQQNTQITMRRFEVVRPMSLTRLDVPMVFNPGSTADAATGNVVFTSAAGIYSRTGNTLSPIVGATGNTTHTWASNSANFSSVSGGRYASFPIATVLQPGEYFLVVALSTTNNSSIGTSTTALGNTISMQVGSTYTASGGFQDFGALSNLSTTGFKMGQGIASVAFSNTSQTFQMSQITMTGTQGVAANIWFAFRNV